MWESICLTLAATAGNNIGKVFQKKGTLILPPFSFKLKVIRAYVFNRAWALGLLMDVFGALLMLKALSQAPVSVIQPVSGSGLAILCVFSHFYLKEVMNALDWIGIALAGVGTIGKVCEAFEVNKKDGSAFAFRDVDPELFTWDISNLLLSYIPSVGVGGEDQEASAISLSHLPWLVFVVFLLFVLLGGWLRICKRQRGQQDLMQAEVVEEIIYGLESGILFGMASVVSKMGFVFLEQGFSKMLAPVCISISICCSCTGFFYQTRGLKHGRAIVVSTCAAVASIVTGVLAGMLALGEQLPSAPTARLWLFLGWVFIITGVIMLVSSKRLIQLFPRSLRHLVRGSDRNVNLRRAGSIRARESSPNTVIQASTLHHLISSTTKEKP